MAFFFEINGTFFLQDREASVLIPVQLVEKDQSQRGRCYLGREKLCLHVCFPRLALWNWGEGARDVSFPVRSAAVRVGIFGWVGFKERKGETNHICKRQVNWMY